MDKNEKQLVESIVNNKSKIHNVTVYIKENYNIESSYDDSTNTLNIWSKNVNESLNLAAAKEYISKTIGEDMLKVKYGK